MSVERIKERLAAAAGEDGNLTLDDMRNAVLDGGFARDAEAAASELGLPPKPAVPDGAPTSFVESMFWKGPCAFPVWSRDRWVFFVSLDGSPMQLPDGSYVKFDTYEEAIEQITGYANWRAAQELSRGAL